MMTIRDFVTDLAEIRAVSPKPYVERHQARQAEELHRGAILKAELLRVNDALMRVAELCYAESADGERDNIEPATGRIVIAKPWGSMGREYFGLSRRTADILRGCLLHPRPSKRPPLFCYDATANDWFINTADYPNLQHAAFWLKSQGISLSEWRQAGIELRAQAAKRRQNGGN